MQISFKKQNGKMRGPPELLRCFHVNTFGDVQVMKEQSAPSFSFVRSENPASADFMTHKSG